MARENLFIPDWFFSGNCLPVCPGHTACSPILLRLIINVGFKNMQRRREIAFVIAIVTGLIIGKFIKKATIGLLIGLVLGLIAAALMVRRDDKEKSKTIDEIQVDTIPASL